MGRTSGCADSGIGMAILTGVGRRRLMVVALGAIMILAGGISWRPSRRIHRGLSTSRLHLGRILCLVAGAGALALSLSRVLCIPRPLVLVVIEPLSLPGVLSLPRTLTLSHALACILVLALALTVAWSLPLLWIVLTSGGCDRRTDPGRTRRTVREGSRDFCRTAGPVRRPLRPCIRVLRTI